MAGYAIVLGEVEKLMREAICFHLECMQVDGEPTPAATTVATAIDAIAAR